MVTISPTAMLVFHTSFLKDDVMLAGRNYTVGLRMFF